MNNEAQDKFNPLWLLFWFFVALDIYFGFIVANEVTITRYLVIPFLVIHYHFTFKNKD